MGGGASKHEAAVPQAKEGRLRSAAKRPDLVLGLRPVMLVEKAAQERRNDDGDSLPYKYERLDQCHAGTHSGHRFDHQSARAEHRREELAFIRAERSVGLSETLSIGEGPAGSRWESPGRGSKEMRLSWLAEGADGGGSSPMARGVGSADGKQVSWISGSGGSPAKTVSPRGGGLPGSAGVGGLLGGGSGFPKTPDRGGTTPGSGRVSGGGSRRGGEAADMLRVLAGTWAAQAETHSPVRSHVTTERLLHAPALHFARRGGHQGGATRG